MIIAGDLNISHRRIDHCDPEGTKVSVLTYLFRVFVVFIYMH